MWGIQFIFWSLVAMVASIAVNVEFKRPSTNTVMYGSIAYFTMNMLYCMFSQIK